MSAVLALAPLLAERRLWRAAGEATGARSGEPSGHAALDAALPGGGWPPGALSEVLLTLDGQGELGLLLPTLARATRQGRQVAMIGPPYLPYAPALAAAGIDLSHLLLVRAEGRDALWATEQALRSGACAAVLCWPRDADDRALRRLAVAAEQGAALGFAFRPRRALAQPLAGRAAPGDPRTPGPCACTSAAAARRPPLPCAGNDGGTRPWPVFRFRAQQGRIRLPRPGGAPCCARPFPRCRATAPPRARRRYGG